MKQFRLGVDDFTLDDLRTYLKFRPPVSISEEARTRLKNSRRAFEKLLRQPEVTIYGVHTGFGKLGNVRIGDSDQAVLQRNLVRSHAVGVGPPLEPDAVRLTLLLKASSLSQGYSGVRPEVVDLLVACLNGDALPVVPSQGSVGASGDLAPLAHIALALMGEGDVRLEGQHMPAAKALEQLGLAHLEYEAKEGLSLLNGTQVSTAVGILALGRLQNLVKAVDIVGALSVDGVMGSPRPFRPEIHALKRHGGQQASAANLYSLMQGSTIRESHRENDGVVQDMYSMRCMPQVHGACREALKYSGAQLLREANSVSDNPLVFADSGQVISAGNFHGEATALACDTAAIAATELGNISERRLFALLAGHGGLPAFLAPQPGLNSGFMMIQVTAAALASENKALAHPASVDTIPMSDSQEDHVPMSMWAARKLLQVVENLEQILALEYLAAVQAVDLHEGLEAGLGARAAQRLLREKYAFVEADRSLVEDIAGARDLIASGAVVEAVERVVALQ